ncbi:MAG: hypothetical protein V1856_01405 [Candidatus Liptonbacteria bacterium]
MSREEKVLESVRVLAVLYELGELAGAILALRAEVESRRATGMEVERFSELLETKIRELALRAEELGGCRERLEFALVRLADHYGFHSLREVLRPTQGGRLVAFQCFDSEIGEVETIRV